MARTFRVAHTPIENSIAKKPISEIDVKLFHYGQPIEDTVFKTADSNGDKTLRQAWRRECLRLNAEFPYLDHWVDDEQPDSEGVYYRGLPGEHTL